MKKPASHPKLLSLSLICLYIPFLLSACGQATPIASPAIPVQTLAPAAFSTMIANPILTQTPVPATASAIPTPAVNVPFDSARAFKDLEYQMSLGPRVPDSPAHTQVVDWMKQSLENSGWTVEIQTATRMGHAVQNIIAKHGTTGQWTIIGAHYDSRMKADQDPDPSKRATPVPAANDGASGVAVLLELARVLPKDLNQRVWLVFFDAEDQGEFSGWDWLLGSRVLAESLTAKPDAVIVIDMIGDANLNIYKEKNSNGLLTDEIWSTADTLGYAQQFIPTIKWDMLDDHTPFLEKGIRAVDIIDFDYPYWHTTADTTDKTSARSLMVVGNTLLHWIVQTTDK